MMVGISLLNEEESERIHQTSLKILEQTGVAVNNSSALALLEENGCSVQSGTATFPSKLIEDSLSSIPHSFKLHSREGDTSLEVGGNSVIYNPASSATNFLDHSTKETRKATAKDLFDIVRLVDALPHIRAQSTAVVASDAPNAISDLYRLYVILKNSTKPIVTGAFTKFGFIDMVQMLEAVVGGAEELVRAPRAIFDCCPSSVLIWSDETCQNLIDCAKRNVPAAIVPAPLVGATSPITLSGTLAQTNAEILSGIVISQLVNTGAPLAYGGATSVMDMRHGTSSIGSIEAAMIACASAAMGKFYKMPTLAYMGNSDAHVVDAQSGFESGLGLILAALARINVVSGPGMLASINCQSLEKLVLDDEICASAYRLIEGVDIQSLNDIETLVKSVGSGGQYLNQKHTRSHVRNEHHFPTDVINRLTLDSWRERGTKDTTTRAHQQSMEILKTHAPRELSEEAGKRLEQVLNDILSRYGISGSGLPVLP
jgi:trimethylamine--corrinoid protein Co-methyltransferase